MIKLSIILGDNDWNVIIYYGINKHNYNIILNQLIKYGCKLNDSIKTINTLLKYKNCAFTFTNTDYKTSIVGIGECTSQGLFVNSVIHESKHVQSHVCEYYGISENGETAAYLIGHIVLRMYKVLLEIKRNLYG